MGVEEGKFAVGGVPLSEETAVALGMFSERMGVPREHAMAVWIGLAENQQRNRDGAMTLARLLLTCQQALSAVPNTVGLRAEIDEVLGQFEVPHLF